MGNNTAPTIPEIHATPDTPSVCPECGHEPGNEKLYHPFWLRWAGKPGTMVCRVSDFVQGGFVDFDYDCECEDAFHG